MRRKDLAVWKSRMGAGMVEEEDAAAVVVGVAGCGGVHTGLPPLWVAFPGRTGCWMRNEEREYY